MSISARTPHKLKPVLPPGRPLAALPIAWAIVILILTLTPAADMPPTPEWELLAFDTAAHAGVFGLLALLSWFSLRRQQRWPRLARHPGWPLLIGSFLFGGLIEVLQSTMHMGRQGDVKDLIGDTIGAALALGLAWLLRHRVPATVALLVLFGTLAAGRRAAAQDVARARQTIETLAAPNLHGRGYVQQGEHLAAAYLRKRFKALGLTPLAPNYTQPFALDVNTFPGKLTLRLHHGYAPVPGPHWALSAGRDFIADPASGGGHLTGQRLRYLDSATVATAAGQQEFLRGRHIGVVVLLDRYSQQPAHLPPAIVQRLDSAAAVLRVVPKLTASVATTQGKQLQLDVLPHDMLHQFGPATSSPAWTADVQLDARLQRNYQTQNLAAVVRGTAQPDSFLVVSAHYDHLGMMGKDVYFPGANDNASGVALLLELAAHYARPENRPACSVVFLLFGAEEAGLLGSQYFVAHPLVPLARIKFLFNLDLLGTGEQGATVVNGRVFEPAYRRLLALNAAHHYLPALAPRGRAANSDHFPFSEAGVPAFFLYTRGGSTAYHDVNDRPAALSLAGFAGAFGLVRDFLNAEGAAPTTKK